MGHSVHAMESPAAQSYFYSAGFAGVAALIAALIIAAAVLYAVKRAVAEAQSQRAEDQRQFEQRRGDELRAATVNVCWSRWWQVLETAALEPAASEGTTLGLGPEVTLEVLRGLLRDAEELGDDTLVRAIAVYREQLVLVLAQQSGTLAGLASPARPSAKEPTKPQPSKRAPTARAAESSAETLTPEEASTSEKASAATKETAGSGRR